MVSRVVLAVLVAERLLELWLARRNAARALARGGVEVGQRHYRVMVPFHALFLVACALEAGPFRPVLFFTFLPGAVLAQALRYWSIWTLGWRWNTRVIVVPGEPPVTGGPYRYMRHPNYLAVYLEMACVPMMLGAWLTAVVFSAGNAALLRVRIRDEERALGSAWEAAFAHKRRLLPGGHGG